MAKIRRFVVPSFPRLSFSVLPASVNSNIQEMQKRSAALPEIWEQRYGISPEKTRHFQESLGYIVESGISAGIGGIVARVPKAFRSIKITKRRKLIPEDIGISSEAFFANTHNELKGFISLKKDTLKVKVDFP